MAIGNINVSTAWYVLFGIRLVHGWSSKIEENGAASAAIVDWRLTKARLGKSGESAQPARRTDAERAGGDVRLAQNAGELQCKHARDRLEVCVVERNWHNRSNRLDARRVKDCPALEAGSETARVHDAVITALICPGGHGLCESAFGSAYAAKVYVGKPELMQSRPEGTPKCLEGREPTYVEPPAAPKVECRGAART